MATEQIMLCARLDLPAPKTEAIAALRAGAAAFKTSHKKAATAVSKATYSATVSTNASMLLSNISMVPTSPRNS